MGIPPPPRFWGHAHCRWHRRGRRGRRVPLVRRLRLGSLLPGYWGAEYRGWLLVHHYRPLRTFPGLSRRSERLLHCVRKTALAASSHVERVTGIEPALSAWEADVLPLNYTRAPSHLPHALTAEPACAEIGR